MILLFVGNNKEILSACAENISGVNTIIITSVEPSALIDQFHPMKEDIRIIIVDINTCKRKITDCVHGLTTEFPYTKLWAIFDNDSESLRAEIQELGFEKIVSYHDDLPSIISHSGLFA
ncbi:MAG: hypothetical protein SF052_25105 [Bacteroidia bacterium]|nr:hypothetical protein [Bacteroidia bacterium]